MNSDLPLTGARKKPERAPRTEGVMRRRGGPIYYARLYPIAGKRAVYRSTRATTTYAAESVLPAMRAELARGRNQAA